ncbi:MinD-like ATPase involved in chromosome partitioning or flagellar assembly [Nocardia sp. GAS34]|uniref:MinD/ParA family ATP-binding protein n=1 Tax=unclassified Nocardia TaxID=2637762 RepID=UPI003D25FB2D
MGQDWSQWLDEAPEAGDPAGSRARGKAPVVRLRKGRRDGDGGDPGSSAPRPILVVGGCGGAGTTTTALGIAGEMGLGGGPTVAVDATSSGSDLALRGADEHLSPISLQAWLYGRGDDEPAPLKECLSQAGSGIGLLWRDAAPLRRRATYLTVARAIADAGYTAVYDGGSPIAARHLRPLLEDAEVALILAIPARADAANRLRVTLEWLDDEFGGHTEGQGGGIVGDTTIVVSHQLPGDESPVAEHLREHLTGWVRDIREIPYDPHLARGELVRHNALATDTRRAYRTLLAGVAS